MKEVLFHLYQLRQEFTAVSTLPAAKSVCAYQHDNLCIVSAVPCMNDEIDFFTIQRINHAVMQANTLFVAYYEQFLTETGILRRDVDYDSGAWCRYLIHVASDCGWRLARCGDAVYLEDVASYSAYVVTDMITEELDEAELAIRRYPEYLGVKITGRTVKRDGFPGKSVSFVRAAIQFDLFKMLMAGGESGVSRSDIRDRLYESNPVNEAALDTRSSDCNKRLEPIMLEIVKDDGRWFLMDKRKVYKK